MSMQDVDLCTLTTSLKAHVQSNRKIFAAALERQSINRHESTNALTFNSIRSETGIFNRSLGGISNRGAEMPSECAPTAKMSRDRLLRWRVRRGVAIYGTFAPIPGALSSDVYCSFSNWNSIHPLTDDAEQFSRRTTRFGREFNWKHGSTHRRKGERMEYLGESFCKSLLLPGAN